MQDHPFAAGLNVVVSRTADKGKDYVKDSVKGLLLG